MTASLSMAMASCGQEEVSPVRTPETTAISPAPSASAESEKIASVQAVKPDGAPVGAPTADDPDAEYREEIVGVWKQQNTGTRWLRIRPDGTGTMYIDPDWVARAVIGDSLTMKIEWSIENGRAVMNSVSGKPQSAFKAVSTLFGRNRNQPIVELNDERFILKDEEDGSLSTWIRVEANANIPDAVKK